MTSILERYPKTAGLVIAAAIAVMLLATAEVVVRLVFPQVNFRGVERGLFAPAPWPGGYANAPGFAGRVFGATASTDEHGFRADRTGHRSFDPARESVLVLGDSVTFGVGVEDGRTFADLLAAAWPQSNVINAAVIGYGLEDYDAALPALLGANSGALQVREIILGICLNDGLPSSKVEILAQVANERGQPAAASPQTPSDGMLARAVAAVNAFLRERSKLYLAAKTLVRDTPRTYFLADRAFYDDPAAVERALRRLDSIVDTLSKQGVRLTVVVFPYAYQLRTPDDPSLWLPQRLILDHLAQKGVPSLDLAEALRRDHAATGRPFSAYFLFDDPMHLSAAGHEVVARALLEMRPAPVPR